MKIDRRRLLQSGATAALLGATASVGAGRGTGAAAAAAPPPPRRVRPGDPAWPSAAEWDGLRQRLGGRLTTVDSPLAGCARDADGSPCADALKAMGNPYVLQDRAGATQQQGWVDAWTSSTSSYVATPRDATEVAAVVDFARERNLRLVIKGAGHSYLGQSNAPDSLLLWTREMNGVEVHDAFVPQGCDSAPVPAVSVGSGARFVELYDAAIVKAGRYVQGGGCTTVGVGGHVQTGGFGSFSKYGGLAAGNLLEAEIVTADGQVRIANRCSNPDLFQALRGGGAGFGVTTRLTLATREIPAVMGFVGQTIRAASDDGFRALLEAFFAFAGEALITPHWGEQVQVGADNSLSIAMVFQGLEEAEVRDLWAPFRAWLADHPEAIADAGTPRIVSMPGRHWWDAAYRKANFPDSILTDDRPDAPESHFWWSGNDGEVGIYLSGYESLWLDEGLLAPGEVARLSDALFAASRHFSVGLHFNKGMAGATPERRAEAREMALHPSVADAFALAIIAGGQTGTFPGVLGHEPDRDAARAEGAKIAAAMAALRAAAPDAGSYSSEMSYFEPNWQAVAWGPNYPALLATKRKYDPDGLFVGHHQVGSEDWTDNGFARRV